MNPENKKPSNPSIQTCTLRDMFANSAMQGILSNADTMRELTRTYDKGRKTLSFQECVSDLSLSFADAMLKQRES